MGKFLAYTLISELPELGQFNRGEIAATPIADSDLSLGERANSPIAGSSFCASAIFAQASWRSWHALLEKWTHSPLQLYDSDISTLKRNAANSCEEHAMRRSTAWPS